MMKSRFSNLLAIMVLSLSLALIGCNLLLQPGPNGNPREPSSIMADEQGIVHILIPCATLTPYQDYRDFMTPGSIRGSGDYVLRGHPLPSYPTPQVGVGETVLPPEEATLVFDNSEGCE